MTTVTSRTATIRATPPTVASTGSSIMEGERGFPVLTGVGEWGVRLEEGLCWSVTTGAAAVGPPKIEANDEVDCTVD